MTVGQARRVEYRERMTSSMNDGGGLVLAICLKRIMMETAKNQSCSKDSKNICS